MLEPIASLLADDFDFKSRFGNKLDYVKYLVELSIKFEFTNIINDDLQKLQYVKALGKILVNVVATNNEKLIEIFLTYLVSLTVVLNDNNLERYNLEIAISINEHYPHKKYKLIIKRHIPQLLFEITKSANRYFKHETYHLYRLFCQELIELYKVSNINTQQLLYNIGFSYHLDAIFQQNRKIKTNGIKASFLERAENHYKKVCNNLELSKDLRPLIKSCYGLMVKNELSQIRTKLPNTHIYQIAWYHYKRLYLKELKTDDILRYMAIDQELLPNYKSIVEIAKETAKAAVFSRTLSITPINENRKLGTFSSVEEHDKYDIVRHYDISLQMIWRMSLFPIFDELINSSIMTQTSIMKHFNQWALVDRARIPILSTAIERFFSDDYVSSIHILIPQIEYHLRYMFEVIGYSTTSTLDGKSQEEQTLGGFLKDDFVKSQLGMDVVSYFEIVFTSKVGLNLRNNIAHGFFDSANFGKGLNAILIYSLILLTRFQPKGDVCEVNN